MAAEATAEEPQAQPAEAGATSEADATSEAGGAQTEERTEADETAEAAPQPAGEENATSETGRAQLEPESESDDDLFKDDPAHKNAARIARVMVADLWLYHRNDVEAGLREGDFEERNKEALQDMRSTYDSRVAQNVRDQKDYLMPAIEDFLDRKRRQLGL